LSVVQTANAQAELNYSAKLASSNGIRSLVMTMTLLMRDL
jgi:hypothetical protein